jgi:hypothetical protein
MDAEHRAFLSKLLEYIIEGCKDIEEQDVEQALLSIGSREAREAYMTLAERLIEKGKAEGRQEMLLQLLAQKFGAVDDADKRKIMGTRDLDRLGQALGLIFKTEAIAEVLRSLD